MRSWLFAILQQTAEITSPFDDVARGMRPTWQGQCTLDFGSTHAVTPTEYNGPIDTGSVLQYDESSPYFVAKVEDVMPQLHNQYLSLDNPSTPQKSRP